MINIDTLTENELNDLLYAVNQKMNKLNKERKLKELEEEDRYYTQRKYKYYRSVLRCAKNNGFYDMSFTLEDLAKYYNCTVNDLQMSLDILDKLIDSQV